MNPKHKATNAVTEILGVEVQADSNVAKVFLSAIQALDSKVELLNDHLAEHGVPTKSPTSIPFGNNANLGALQTGENASTNSETNKKETNFEDTVEVANVAEQVGDRVYVETSGGDVLGDIVAGNQTINCEKLVIQTGENVRQDNQKINVLNHRNGNRVTSRTVELEDSVWGVVDSVAKLHKFTASQAVANLIRSATASLSTITFNGPVNTSGGDLVCGNVYNATTTSGTIKQAGVLNVRKAFKPKGF